ncbi:MAG: hypothetical protein QF415_01390 [Candidatus Undinarchaeales archaeon]|jgi:aspartokinase-like uncharacterized kinase|nr:hypothetical protein [Candidatus Undinarchaeales archaeon]MDP7493304.1 hypothetical protein [Candidatus Undinarchaeales archaeon]
MRLVVKVGGSLTRDRARLLALLDDIKATGADNDVIIVPGGGGLADTVRALDDRFALSTGTSHKMALLAMESMARMLAQLMDAPLEGGIDELRCERTGVRVVSIMGVAPALDIPEGWHVTSDSIALYVAAAAGAELVVLAKDVDGVYTADPSKGGQAERYATIAASELSRLHDSPVDDHFPQAAESLGMEAVLVHGGDVGIVRSIAAGKPLGGTRIIPA